MTTKPNQRHLTFLRPVLDKDYTTVLVKEAEYNSSWKKRGGAGAFMMLARKWDRLEEQVQRHGWDIFLAAHGDGREEGILDDIGDLRRYLALVEAEVRSQFADKASEDHTRKTADMTAMADQVMNVLGEK